MIPDTLFKAAFQFRKTKLWQRLYDTQIFALQHSDGTIGYCCVMGRMGEHLALAVYPGGDGLASYRKMGESRSALNPFEAQELALAQDCVMLSFENKEELRPREIQETRTYCAGHQITLRGKKSYPQFQRFRPHHFPWYIDDATDQEHLLEGLEACFAIAAKLEKETPEALGFTEGAPFDRKIPLLQKKDGRFIWETTALPKAKPIPYPAPEAHDDIALARIAKSKKHGKEWACDIFMHIDPMTDETTEIDEEPVHAPFYPYLLIIVDNETGRVLNIQLSDDPEDYTEIFTQAVLTSAQSSGNPSRILVCNKRTHAFFSKLSTQLNVTLTTRERLPFIEEAEQELIDHMMPDGEDETDESAQLLDMLRDPQALAEMPDSLLLQLRDLVCMKEFPKDIVENVRRECTRRGLQ